MTQISSGVDKQNIKVLSFESPDYPKILREIHNPPRVLYYIGNIKCLNSPSVAIVGSRKATNYGKQITEIIARDLSENNITIVSGLAFGIDTLAHTATLENGKTIGVLGSGIDNKNFYPQSNLHLAKKIIEKDGIIISEYPPGTPPLKHHFPERNRIISGIALGALVVEAAEKSGSLITARLALEQNREVFAIPGSIFGEFSCGPNNLIKMGARAVTCALDILEILNIEPLENSKQKKLIADTKEEKTILEFLTREPIHIDELKRQTKLDIAILSSTLTMMEMKGKVKNLGGLNYVLGR